MFEYPMNLKDSDPNPPPKPGSVVALTAMITQPKSEKKQSTATLSKRSGTSKMAANILGKVSEDLLNRMKSQSTGKNSQSMKKKGQDN